MSMIVVRLHKDKKKPEKGHREKYHEAFGWKFDVDGNLEIHTEHPNDNQTPLEVYSKEDLRWVYRVNDDETVSVEGPVKFAVEGEHEQW